ncbi:hypothetical protein [Pleomorphomonas koreensis]|uniref:hypothetical protein n=1 Tax=Pleomorphomonas koreensis TaxID=257440 RepID=UPI0012EB8A52|nr:hypothetical protein [Pleomorphomonas koreensis]
MWHEIWNWDSLSSQTAERISTVANAALLTSLLVGVVATYAIIVSANTKERFLRAELSAADERASMANEAAARLAKEAEEARLETERIKKELAWRTVLQSQGDFIVERLKGLNAQVWFQVVTSDAETRAFASVLGGVLQAAGLDLQLTEMLNGPDAGLQVSTNGVGPAILATLIEAGIPARPANGYETGSATGQVVIIVGTKPPPTLSFSTR